MRILTSSVVFEDLISRIVCKVRLTDLDKSVVGMLGELKVVQVPPLSPMLGEV